MSASCERVITLAGDLHARPAGALAVAAGTSGFLFTINSALPFTLLALISASLGLTTLWWWRNVTGNITDTV